MDYEALGIALALMVKEHLRAEMGALVNQVEVLSKELAELKAIPAPEPVELPEVKNGEDGRGIEGAGINDDGFLVLHYTDGTEQTLGRVVGASASVDLEQIAAEAAKLAPVVEPGDPPTVEQVAEATVASLLDNASFLQSVKGDIGVGIEAASINEEGNLWLRMTNETQVNLGRVVGADGQAPTAEAVAESIKQDGAFLKALQGQDGASIVDAYIDEEKHLAVVLGNGSIKKLGRVVGKDGEPGKEGLGFDDLEVVQEGRDVKIVFTRGDETRSFGLLFNVPEYRGIWEAGSYRKGDFVTFGGALWHANGETEDKPGTSRGWTLAVKKGRDGKGL